MSEQTVEKHLDRIRFWFGTTFRDCHLFYILLTIIPNALIIRA